MAFCFVSLVSLVKPYDTVDPNSEITYDTLFKIQKMVKRHCKPTLNNGQV